MATDDVGFQIVLLGDTGLYIFLRPCPKKWLGGSAPVAVAVVVVVAMVMVMVVVSLVIMVVVMMLMLAYWVKFELHLMIVVRW